MAHYLLTASGEDRPGLVAAVAETLFAAGCNLEDSAMTRLQGTFAMLVIFSAPDDARTEDLAERLRRDGRGLAITLKPIDRREAHPAAAPAPAVLITVYGADRPGIVAGVTEVLAKAGANITDLTTHRTATGDRAGDAGGYILYIEAVPPAPTTPEDLETSLQPAARALGVTLTVKPLPTADL